MEGAKQMSYNVIPKWLFHNVSDTNKKTLFVMHMYHISGSEGMQRVYLKDNELGH